MAKRISILGVRKLDGFWQGTALFEATETLWTSDLDATVYAEDVARETFIHVFTVVSEQSAAIRDVVSGGLVETYNKLWRKGRTSTLTRAVFAKKLTIDRIHSSEPDHPSRLISVHLGGQEMLGGHRVSCLLGWEGAPLFAPAIAT